MDENVELYHKYWCCTLDSTDKEICFCVFLSSQTLLYHFCSRSHLKELVKGLYIPIPLSSVIHMLYLAVSVSNSCSVMPDSLQPHGL